MKPLARPVATVAAFAAMTGFGVLALTGQALAQVQPVPEPSSMALMAVGVGAVAVYHKLRKRK